MGSRPDAYNLFVMTLPFNCLMRRPIEKAMVQRPIAVKTEYRTGINTLFSGKKGI